MQWYFTRYYKPLHKMLLVLSNIYRQKRQKRVSVKIGFARKKDAAVIQHFEYDAVPMGVYGVFE